MSAASLMFYLERLMQKVFLVGPSLDPVMPAHPQMAMLHRNCNDSHLGFLSCFLEGKW
jgi:hypothetical protein